MGSLAPYRNRAKRAMLGVDQAALQLEGGVSKTEALATAEGCPPVILSEAKNLTPISK